MAAGFVLPSVLYHGTRSSLLPRIAAEGLQPRSLSGSSNWSHSVESREDAVYLTRAYGLHYARACRAPGDPVLLEIRTAHLDPTLFASDEDGVAQLRAGQAEAGPGATLAEATLFWRERIHTVHPSTSLSSLGNCAYFGGVPPEAISRVLALSEADALRLTLQACDPVVSTMNYRFFGDQFRAFSAWLFDPQGHCPSSPLAVGPPASSPVSLLAASMRADATQVRVP